MDCDHSITVSDDQGGGTTVSAVHPDIIRSHIFPKLDGFTLASAGCASVHLHSLSSDEQLWRNICQHTWPSTADPRVQQLISTFPSGYRSFYAYSFPTLHHHRRRRRRRRCHRLPQLPTRLVSAVDIHYRDKIVISKVEETETESQNFLRSDFLIDLLGQKQRIPVPVNSDNLEGISDNLRVNWILIDPTRKRSGTFSFSRPVSAQRHWLTGEIELQYVRVLAGDCPGAELVQCGVVVTFGGREGGGWQVKEVRLQVEDIDGRKLSGEMSLRILQEALERGERKKRGKVEEERKRYEEFLGMQRERRERKQRRDMMLDLAGISTIVTFFMAFWVYLFNSYILILL